MKISNKLYNDIQKYVELGYIMKQQNGPLAHYNYSSDATFDRKWNAATLACRGLILDETNRDIIAKPFDKFFNYHEIEQHTIPFDLAQETTIKMDGVFGYSFFYKGQMRWATRWNIETPNALLAKKIFEEKYPNVKLPEHITVMYEIIHPLTEILCKYDFTDLIVLGAHDLKEDKDFNYKELEEFCKFHGLTVVEQVPYDIFTALSVAKTLDKNEEGYVIRFSNGVRIKAKGQEYVELARLMHGFSDKQLTVQWAKYKEDEIVNNPTIPEEFRDLLLEKLEKLNKYENNLFDKINEEYATVQHAENQREFAEWVHANYEAPMTAFLFKRHSRKSLKIREYVLTNKLYYDILGKSNFEEQ